MVYNWFDHGANFGDFLRFYNCSLPINQILGRNISLGPVGDQWTATSSDGVSTVLKDFAKSLRRSVNLLLVSKFASFDTTFRYDGSM